MPYIVTLTVTNDATISVTHPDTDEFIEDLDGQPIEDRVLVKDGFVEFKVTPDNDGIARITIISGGDKDFREIEGGGPIFFPENKIAPTLLNDLRRYKDIKELAKGIKQENDNP